MLKAPYGEMAAQPFDPMTHPQQSNPVGLLQVVLKWDAYAVVANGKLQDPAAKGKRHLHVKCLGVAMYIEQRFLRHSKKCKRNLAGMCN